MKLTLSLIFSLVILTTNAQDRAQKFLEAGISYFQNGNFKEAYTAFSQALVYRQGDTTLTYYAGLSAINAQDYNSAIASYSNLIRTNYSQNKLIYLDLSKLYALERDTTTAIRIANEGFAKYNDYNLGVQEIELSILSKTYNGLVYKIKARTREFPYEKTLPFYLGYTYNDLGQVSMAEDAYKKAIELDPTYFEAFLNLGTIFINKGIDYFNKANQLPSSSESEYIELLKIANDEFDKALPYLQQAVTLSPQSLEALENLKTVYVIKRVRSKIDELNSKIASLRRANSQNIEDKNKSHKPRGYIASGTGFVISRKGYIVTNYHVIEDSKKIEIKVFSNKGILTFDGEVVAQDPINDLAIIKVDDSQFNALNLFEIKARSNPINVGEDIFVMGYPRIQYLGQEIKITNGIINSKSGYQDNNGTFQISAPLQAGNSGGPVIDSNGNLVGIAFAGIPDMQNIGYAIKTNYLQNLVSKLPIDAGLISKINFGTLKLPEKVKILRSSVVLITVE